MADRALGIPGEDLPGTMAAREFVGWCNGHPDVPADDARVESLPAFSWSSVRRAAKYEFQLSADADFGSVVLGQGRGSFQTQNTYATIDKALPNGTYHWRVRAIDADCTPVAEVSPFGPTSAIFILPPGSPQGTVPLGEEGIVTFTVVLGPEFAGQSFTVTTSESWLTPNPASGIVPAGGITITITGNTAGLGVGANYGAVVVTLNSSSARVGTKATTTVTSTVSAYSARAENANARSGSIGSARAGATAAAS